MNKHLLLLLAIPMLFVACRTPKKTTAKQEPAVVVTQPSAKQTLIDAVLLNENKFEYYQSRGSGHYKDNDQEHDLGMEIVMERDKYVYVNVTAVLGISVARLWITRDSIDLLDMIHREHVATNFSYLSAIAHVPLDLAQLQRMIIGNTMYRQDPESSRVDTTLSNILIHFPLRWKQLQTTSYDAGSLKVMRTLVNDTQTNRQMQVEYGSVQENGRNRFPKDITINIKAEKSMECRLNLDYFAFEKKKETKFVVPKNYKTIRR